MHRSTSGAIALGTALVAVVAPAAGAQAATLTVSQPCQVATFGLSAVLSGFTPNSTVSIQGDQIFETATVDATGSATVPFTAPLLGSSDPKSKQVILTATDNAAAPVSATTRFRTANFAFGTTGGQQSPKATRTWTFSGLTPGKAIYGHFRYNGQTRANHRFGVAKGPCGELTVKAPGIPVKGGVNTGKWTVQIDQKKIFNRATRPRLTGSVTVFKVVKP
ncbi:MAG: hypothetical protein JWN65_3852 [Solirubrobacterales bacterium]|nr:hypothetical protein [Solirubrobacterales bacterium]